MAVIQVTEDNFDEVVMKSEKPAQFAQQVCHFLKNAKSG